MAAKDTIEAGVRLIQSDRVELVNVLSLLVIGLVCFVCALAWRGYGGQRSFRR